jgi:hypothetical protein
VTASGLIHLGAGKVVVGGQVEKVANALAHGNPLPETTAGPSA